MQGTGAGCYAASGNRLDDIGCLIYKSIIVEGTGLVIRSGKERRMEEDTVIFIDEDTIDFSELMEEGETDER